MIRPAAPGGPYQTERQAAAAASRSCAAAPGVSLAAGNHRLLKEACTAAQLKLGDWDHTILTWLAGWEPSTCAVIAGLITRAATGQPPCPRPVPARAKKAP
jgi:hypothetical protein